MNDTSDIDPTWPYQLLSEFLSLPTFCIVCALGVQHYKKGFNGTFQKLVYICLVNDMCWYYSQMFIFRRAQMDIFGIYRLIAHTFLPTILAYILMTVLFHQHLMMMLIAAHRTHSLFAPLGYKEFWKKYTFKLVLVAFILPQPLTIFVTVQGAHYEHFALYSAYLDIHGLTVSAARAQFGIGASVSMVILVLNGFTVVQLIMFKRLPAHKRSRIHLKFHFYSFYTFFLELLLTTALACTNVYTFGTTENHFCMMSANVIVDVYCLSSVWIWLLMSSDARRLLWKGKTCVQDSAPSAS